MPLIKAKYSGRCSMCGIHVEKDEMIYYANKKVVCTACGEEARGVASAVSTTGPVAASLQFHGTSMELVRYVRSIAQNLAVNLKEAARQAEVLTLTLKQVEDQQKESPKK